MKAGGGCTEVHCRSGPVREGLVGVIGKHGGCCGGGCFETCLGGGFVLGIGSP